MIHFNSQTRTFNLVTRSTTYVFQVDFLDRLVHLGWRPRPAGAGAGDLIRGNVFFMPANLSSFEQQTDRYELVTFGDVAYHETGLKLDFQSLPATLQVGEAAHLPVRDVRLRYVSHAIVTDGRPGFAPDHGLPARVMTPRETLRVLLADPVQPFEVVLCYRVTPEHDIIERWCELRNTGAQPVTVEQAASATLHLPNGRYELTSVYGMWAQEFSVQQRALPVGLEVLESRTLNTGHAANPFFLVNETGQAGEESGTVYFGQLAYSGAYRIVFEQLPTLNARIHAGSHAFDDELVLAPGAAYRTPAVVCGVAPDGRGGASRRMHAFARDYVLPHTADLEPRPVLYNSWEATYFDLSLEGQTALARKAAAMGVELFCVDDGWFGGRRSDRAGLGDWVVSTAVFPDGLQPLIDEVQRLGMQFGLWVEPEMVNPDSDLYRAHPDWVLHFPGRGRSESRNQLILDLGRPEVNDYLFAALDGLLSSYAIRFIKWDFNRSQSEPGSVAGKGIYRAHVAGFYALLDRLRRAHPQVSFQSCSGGGGRVDVGVLGRVDQVWTSDNTDALARVAIQDGYSLAYPARAMEAWVTHAQNHQTGRVLELSLRFDVAMRGVLGIGSNLNELDEPELRKYTHYIAYFKRLRHIVHNGDLYRLQRPSQYGASVVEYVLPDGSEAVYSVVVVESRVGQFRQPAPLRGLNNGDVYAIYDDHGRVVQTMTGYELMTQGIPGDAGFGVGASQTLHIKRA